MSIWQRLLSTLLLCICTPMALADAPANPAGEQLLKRFMTALQRHDLQALDNMIARNAPFEVTWLDSTPPKRFTMTRDDYLQQLRATWHFSQQEQLLPGKALWLPNPANGTARVRFHLEEKRIILGTATGQASEIELDIAPDQGPLRITGIRTRTRTW